MTNLIDDAEAIAKVAGAAASPYLIYAKLAGAALLVIGIAAGGWWGRGVWDKADVAQAHADTSTAQAATAQCVAIHEKARADGAEGALTALNNATAAAADAMDRLSAQAASRGKSLETLITEIKNAPSARSCGASAPELAFRRSVQHAAPAVPAAAP